MRMAGIAGIERKAARVDAENMLATITHRGPAGRGILQIPAEFELGDGRGK